MHSKLSRLFLAGVKQWVVLTGSCILGLPAWAGNASGARDGKQHGLGRFSCSWYGRWPPGYEHKERERERQRERERDMHAHTHIHEHIHICIYKRYDWVGTRMETDNTLLCLDVKADQWLHMNTNIYIYICVNIYIHTYILWIYVNIYIYTYI